MGILGNPVRTCEESDPGVHLPPLTYPRSNRLLFRFALRVFYGNIILENVENIPPRGVPWSADMI